MQFIKANRDAILKPLQTVAGIVERRHTLPILANVLLRKSGENVSFLATDVEIQIQTTAQLGAGKEDGGTTVSARKLIDILRSLPDGADVTVKVENRRATIQTGKSRFALQTLAAEEYPTVSVNEQFGASFTLPQKQLKHLFHMVHFAMAQQDIRYYLNGLLLVTDGAQVRVVATDGHRLALCEATVEGAELARQEVIIPRKTVLELQRLLADSDDPVLIDVSGNQVRFRFGEVEMISKLVEGKFPDYQRVVPHGYTRRATIETGKSRFALQTLAAEEYPTVSVNEQFGASFTLPQKQLKHLFHMVHFAMAQQDIRYYLNGLLLVTDGAQVRVVATDGHRLALCEATVEGAELARQEVIIPRKTVLELQRLLADSDDPVLIDVSGNQVRFRFGEVEMISKLVEGKFPDYQRVVPHGYTRRATIAREVLAAALARASILTTEKFKGVRLSLAPGTLQIQTSNAEQEEAVEEIEVGYDGEPLEIGFNVGYLQDVLGNLRSESVHVDFGDASSSALITVPEEAWFKYVVMPMRI
ncbi:MAG: hypothetical protein BGO72_17305 [Burkholderiales bacterium 70-64]|nr:MAG: hypothetical protein BGO72_17305 [Burkholderiales bacterium 70-64]